MVKAYCDICGKELQTGIGFGIAELPSNNPILSIQACPDCGELVSKGVEKVIIKVIEKINKKDKE